LPGALDHVRVLDLSRVLAGPWATQLLADLGAEVVKIERPGEGDETRGWGPPYLRDASGTETRESAYYLSANRGKKSVALDLSRPEGQDVVRRLAAASDVLVENFRAGGLARYGLDWPSLGRVNPRLVYCSITGFGQSGPYRDRPGYDFLVQGMGGLMSVTGEPDGEPMKVGVAITDLLTGLYASNAILAALAARERTGRGQHVDLALLDVQVATLANQASNHLVGGLVPRRLGNAHPNIVPYQAFAASDGDLVLAVGNDAQFQRLCEVAGAPELAKDPRFATNAGRVRHREALVPRVAALFRTRPRREWIDALAAAGVPCGPIQDVAEVFQDPQVRHRGLRVDVPHPSAGTVPLVACPIRLSETPVSYDAAPPLLGQHTREVLASVAGLSGEQIDALVRGGIAAVGPA
jgi:crotonobetainyl-CoA:carnitine CoA-transferase CaiB-like acyl-CoA transferase